MNPSEQLKYFILTVKRMATRDDSLSALGANDLLAQMTACHLSLIVHKAHPQNTTLLAIINEAFHPSTPVRPVHKMVHPHCKQSPGLSSALERFWAALLICCDFHEQCVVLSCFTVVGGKEKLSRTASYIEWMG